MIPQYAKLLDERPTYGIRSTREWPEIYVFPDSDVTVFATGTYCKVHGLIGNKWATYAFDALSDMLASNEPYTKYTGPAAWKYMYAMFKNVSHVDNTPLGDKEEG